MTAKDKQLNTIPEGWVEMTLEKCIDLIIDHRGKTPKKMGGDWSNSGYRAISAKTVKNGSLVNETQMNLLSGDLYKKWMKDEIQKGDIFLTSEAPLGEHLIWKSDEKLVLSQRIFGIRTNKKILDPFYFNYFIDSPYYQHELKSRESGSTVTGIKQSELLKTKVIFPSLPEQRAIAEVLSSFDDKIELLREQNKTLEQIAQTIFKEWFGKYSVDRPDELPDGWRVGQIKDIINILSGFAFKSANFFGNGKYGLVTIRNVQDGSFVQDTKDRLNELPKKMPNYCLLSTGDILLSLTGNVGRICHVIGDNYLLNQRVAKLTSKEALDFGFTYTLFRQSEMIGVLENLSSGTAQQNLSPIKTGELEIVIPNRSRLNEFADLVNPMISKILDNELQITSLEEARDTLLPKLMTGEIRVNLNK